MKDLVQALDSVWGTILTAFSWDPVKQSLTLEVTNPGNKQSHKIEFRKVGCFLWSAPKDLRGAEWEYAELTSIGLRPKQDVRVQISGFDDSDEYSAFPQFVIELWDLTVLLVEADAIAVDGRLWELKQSA